MAAIDLAFLPKQWLAEYTSIRLSLLIEAGLKILQETQAQQKWEGELNLLLGAVRAISQPQEKAYALLQISEASARMNHCEIAHRLLTEGLDDCKEINEIRAVMEWILGAVEWLQRSGISAYQHWTDAHNTLEGLGKIAVRDHQEGKAHWCRETVRKIDDLVVEMTASVQGGYLIFNRYSQTQLSKATFDLVQLMKDHLVAGKDAEVEKIISLVEKHTRFSQEYPEVLVECALAEYELGDVSQVAKRLRKAQIAYLGEKEKLLAVTWMAAAVGRYLKGAEEVAKKNWHACGLLLDELLVSVERMKDPFSQEKQQWYAVLAKLHQRIMAELAIK